MVNMIKNFLETLRTNKKPKAVQFVNMKRRPVGVDGM